MKACQLQKPLAPQAVDRLRTAYKWLLSGFEQAAVAAAGGSIGVVSLAASGGRSIRRQLQQDLYELGTSAARSAAIVRGSLCALSTVGRPHEGLGLDA